MTPPKKDNGNGNSNAAEKAANKHAKALDSLLEDGAKALEELGDGAVGDLRTVVAGLVARAAK
jgi:hypothetical protein